MQTKTRPIIFNGEMVRAILDGRKTQTRRVVKLRTEIVVAKSYQAIKPRTKKGQFLVGVTLSNGTLLKCPYGIPGDGLWVRETLKKFHREPFPTAQHLATATAVPYADGAKRGFADRAGWEWKRDTLPSIFMPRWASRITLEIVDVRVERLKELTDDDCRAEGISGLGGMVGENTAMLVTGTASLEEAELVTLADGFVGLWDSINSKRGHSWDSNPWVWVIEFEVVDE